MAPRQDKPIRDLVLALAVILFAAGAAAPVLAEAEKGPAYWCAEASYEKLYQRRLKELDRAIRFFEVGAAAASEARRMIRGAANRYYAAQRAGRKTMAAAIRSCDQAAYSKARTRVRAALKTARGETKKELEAGRKAVAADAAKYRASYRAVLDKWSAAAARCVATNASKFGTGSKEDWDAYRLRMKLRITRLRNKSEQAARGGGRDNARSLAQTRRNALRNITRSHQSLAAYPRPCSIAVRLPEVGDWAGKWATNRGELCIKAAGGGLTVTPVDGGLLHRRRGNVVVTSVTPTHVRGTWSIPSPKFEGRFVWRRVPRKRAFQGSFSEKPDDPPKRPWTGRRVGGC